MLIAMCTLRTVFVVRTLVLLRFAYISIHFKTETEIQSAALDGSPNIQLHQAYITIHLPRVYCFSKKKKQFYIQMRKKRANTKKIAIGQQ